MHVLIRQARVTDPRSGFHNQVVDILIEEGIIKNIAASIDAGDAAVIDATGMQVSPGWVDILADYREPGYEHKETIASGLNAAAAGGFTRVLIAPNTHPSLSSKSAVQYVLGKASGHAVSLHPLGTVSQDAEGKVLSEMMDMYHHGAIAFSDGWKPVQNAGLMMKALEYIKAFDGTIIQIPVDNALAAGGLMHEGPVSTQLGMAGIPALAETLQVHRDIELLRYTGSRLHISGVSSAASVEMIRKAKAEGLNITCSVTPYHLALNDEALRSYSSLYKVMPPLRSEADRLALIDAVNDGTIDCITSHHRPQEWDAKAKEFEYASDGMNVQELAFNIAWTAVKEKITEEKLVAALSLNARKIFGLPEAAIETGSKAEITIFTTAGKTVVGKDEKQSLSANNPFLDRETDGIVYGIINNHRIKLNQYEKN
jgi:dihydroorotase